MRLFTDRDVGGGHGGGPACVGEGGGRQVLIYRVDTRGRTGGETDCKEELINQSEGQQRASTETAPPL